MYKLMQSIEDKLLELTVAYNNAKVEYLTYRYSDKYSDDDVKSDALIHNLEQARTELEQFKTENMLGK